MAPCLTSRPLEMITTSSTVCSTSWSMWLEIEDRLALGGQVAQEPAQPPDALGVEAVGRLVEDEHLRVAEHGGGEAEALAHAHRVAAGALAGGRRDADQLEHLVDALGADPGGVGEDAQVVAAGAARVEVGRLQRGADDRHRLRDVVVAVAADGRGAAGRADQAEQHAQRGRLARAVGAEEAGDAAGLDGEGQAVDGGEVAEPLGQVAHLDAGALRCGVSVGCGHRSPGSRLMRAHPPN